MVSLAARGMRLRMWRKQSCNHRSKRMKKVIEPAMSLRRCSNHGSQRKGKISYEDTSLRRCSTELHELPRRIKRGDIINLSDLLFTKHRNYLIKPNNQRVLANQLEGKVIVLHFIELPLETYCDEFTSSLLDIYKELHPKGCFEVVLIPLTSNHHQQPEIYSSMHYPAIPFSDLESRQKLKNIFTPNQVCFPISYVIDPAGVVLHCHADVAFHTFGAPGYPFSYQQINSLWSEDAAAIKNPSITRLLTSPQRDYVISRQGGKVAVSDLEDKTVALYFFDESVDDVVLTSELESAYSMAKSSSFEVVLIYVHDTPETYQRTSKESFQRRFSTMPWLALPFGDPTCKKLERIFRYPGEEEIAPDPTLVIIGPHGRFVEPLGKAVLLRFGIEAYPFTREAAAKLEAEEARMLNLEMLCKNPYMFFKQKDGTKVRFSQLAGKRTLLLVGSDLLKVYKDFFKKLKARYLHLKGTDSEFEVIHIAFKQRGFSYDRYFTEQEPAYDKCVAVTPWPVAHFAEGSYEKELISLNTGILGFDSDGWLVMRTVVPSPEWVVNMDFPFHARSLEDDALIVFDRVYGWYWSPTEYALEDTSDDDV